MQKGVVVTVTYPTLRNEFSKMNRNRAGVGAEC